MKRHHGQKNTAVGHKSQQSGGRFLCFKTIGVEIGQVSDKALFYEDKEFKVDSSSGEKGSRRKGFARAFKAVLFHPKSRMRDSENSAGDGSCSFRLRKRNHDSESEIGLTKSSSMRSTSSSTSSSSSSSSCLTSQTSESPITSNPVNPKPLKQSSVVKQSSFKEQSSVKKQRRCMEQQQRLCSNPNVIGAVLIVLSLTLTIFGGRLWAMGLNAVWLCSIPKQGRRRLTALTSTSTASFQRGLVTGERTMMECSNITNSVEQKKRVIMGGLLDRRHHHHQHHQNYQQLVMP